RVRLSEAGRKVRAASQPGEVGVIVRVYPDLPYPYEVRWPSCPAELFATDELELARCASDCDICDAQVVEDVPADPVGEVPPEDTLQRIKETLERIESNIPKPVEANLEATIEAQAEEIAFLNRLLDKAERHNTELADRNRILRAENEALREELERAQKEVWRLAPQGPRLGTDRGRFAHRYPYNLALRSSLTAPQAHLPGVDMSYLCHS